MVEHSPVHCYYCGRGFSSMPALRAHLRFCTERRRTRNLGKPFPVKSGTFVIYPRSQRVTKLVQAEHALLQAGRRSQAAFGGFIEGLRQSKKLDFDFNPVVSLDSARALPAQTTAKKPPSTPSIDKTIADLSGRSRTSR